MTDIQPIELVFTEEYDQDDNHLLRISVSAELKDVVKKIQDVCNETGLKSFREEWKSKYNHYVMYDHEPFRIDGFNYIVSFEYDEFNENRFAFTKVILGEWIKKVNNLNKLLELSA